MSQSSTPERLRFCDLKPGMKVRVVGCGPECPMTDRLADLGLTPGAEFEVKRYAPFGDPVEIRVRGCSLCLRGQESDGIVVEPI
jgi:ferrous iron transport protein A